MKIKISKNELIEPLTVATGLCRKASAMPALSSVLFLMKEEGLEIKATDLNSAMSQVIGAELVEGKEGSFGVNGALLLEYLQNLEPGEISLTLKGEWVMIEQGGSKAKIPLVKTDEYPDFEINERNLGVKIKTEDLNQAVKRALISVSSDESRPILEGIYFKKKKERVLVVGTDGYRLSVSEIDYQGEWSEDVLISAKSVAELIKGMKDEWIELGVDKKNNQVIVKNSKRRLGFRLIIGDYPNFEKIIPEGGLTKVEIDKDSFSSMVAQVSVFARQNANIIKMDIGKKMKLSTQSGYSGIGEVVGDCAIKGEEVSIAFNYRYLKEWLTLVKEGEVRMVINGSLSPVKFYSSESDFCHIIMPVKI